MSRTSDPLGLMVVRVHAALCAACDCAAAAHRSGVCTCNECDGWHFGRFDFVPDRPVPAEMRAALKL